MAVGADTVTAIDCDFGENIRQHRMVLEAMEKEHTEYKRELSTQEEEIHLSLEKLGASGLMSEEEVQVIRTARESRLQDERIKRAGQFREKVQNLCKQMQREMTTFAGREKALFGLGDAGLPSQPSATLPPAQPRSFTLMNPPENNQVIKEGATAQRGFDYQRNSPASIPRSNGITTLLTPQESEIVTPFIAQDDEVSPISQDSGATLSSLSQNATVIKLESTSPPQSHPHSPVHNTVGSSGDKTTGTLITRPTPSKPQHKRVIDSRIEKPRAEKPRVEKTRVENFASHTSPIQPSSRPVIGSSYRAESIPPPHWYSRNDARTKTGDGYLQNGLGLTSWGFAALRSIHVAQDVLAQGDISSLDNEGISRLAWKRARELRLALLGGKFNLGRIPEERWTLDALKELYIRGIWAASSAKCRDRKGSKVDAESANSTEEFRFLGVKFRNKQQDGIHQVQLEDGKRHTLRFNNSFKPYTEGGRLVPGVNDFTIRPQYAKEILYHRPASLLYFSFRDGEPSGSISLSVTLSCTLTLDRLLKECSEGWPVEPQERDTLAFATYR